jgi:Fe2+ or Zn2+ uptake regulation protein
MTKEGLHRKAEISEELGYRDMQISQLREQLAKVTAERDAVCLAVFDQRGKPVNEELLNKVRGIVKDVDLLKQAEAL